MPDSAQNACQDGDTARVQSLCSDMATQAVRETSNIGDRNTGGATGVDILPIPPAVEFPYPSPATPSERRNNAKATLNTEPPHTIFEPVRKSATSPPDDGEAGSRRLSNPGTPGLLQRIGSAPLRPGGPRAYGSERPIQMRQSSSLLRRFPSRKDKEESAYFNPDLYTDYEESSGGSDTEDEAPVDKDTAVKAGGKPDGGKIQRTRTLPNRQSSSNPYRRFAFGNESYQTKGHISKNDGRLNIALHETAKQGYLAKALGASIESHLKPHRKCEDDQGDDRQGQDERKERPQPTRTNTASTISDLSVDDPLPVPKLNIVVMVIGSRGDIQPFLRLGKILKEDHGHRVRIATHPTFKEFVEEDAKLEFFDVGGDPAELMAFMVKNPGLVPRTKTLRSGEIPRRRAQMFEMFQGFWRACISSGSCSDDIANGIAGGAKDPFVADAIIANPPSFAHIHCAERLGIPLHLMFTFPNTPTQQFPHPLTNIRQTNVDANYTNLMSYPLVEMVQWQGLGDLINDFRVKTLGLDPMSMLWAPGQLYRMKVPYSYLWSPGLIPKPPDWGDEINITGFVFLDLASSFKPPETLQKFLDAGEPPVYIGFGSIVLDDPDKFTNLIFEAVGKAGVRALVSKGWGGLGAEDSCPENVFLLDNTPHDWLFPRVKAVVHHGGAGTTAIGLKCGKPTMVVPFFGDQPFWGAMISKAGAGADPVPYKQLTADKLAEGIKLLLTPEKQRGASDVASKIASEGDGAVNAVKSFHKQLPRQNSPNMRCSILTDRVATWHLKETEVRLSSLAAHMLVQQRKITWNELRLIRIYDWNDFEGPGEPITGMGTSLLGSLIGIGAGVGKIPFHWAKIIRQKEVRDKKIRQKHIQQLRTEVREHDKETRSQGKDEAKRAVQAEVARRKVDPKSKDNSGDAGAEAKLPDGNQPGNSSQSLGQVSNGPREQSPRPEDMSDLDIKSDTGAVFKQLVLEGGRGLRESGTALAKLPMNLFLALAEGLHNVPRLYGDDTVRTPRRITGFHSGCRVAAFELCYGVYDGFTGLVKQPYIGAKYEGAPGLFKGVGKGVGGFLFKDAAAIFGIPAYTLKGVHKELTKHRQPTAFMRRSRIIEGAQQFVELSGPQKGEIAKEVSTSWVVVEDVRMEVRRTIKEKGIRGRVEIWRNRKWLKANGITGNVKGMQRALDSYRAGRDWKEEFHEEREHHERQQARAIVARREARHKKAERDENGKRNKGPDLRMKTRFGTNRALKKIFKKSEKRAEKAEKANAQKPQDSASGSDSQPSKKPEPRTNMADKTTGTSAIDQALLGPDGQADAHLSNAEVKSNERPEERVETTQSGSYSNADIQHRPLATPSPRSAVSDDTLFQEEETDDPHASLPKSDMTALEDGTVKVAGAREADKIVEARMPLPRTVAA